MSVSLSRLALDSVPLAMFSLDEWRRKLFFSAAFACFTAIVLRASLFLGEESAVYDHKPGKCRNIPLLGNVITARQTPGRSFVISFSHSEDKEVTAHLTSTPKENKNNDTVESLELTIKADKLKHFNPISVTSYIEGASTQKKHRIFVYVLSKTTYSSKVEVFELAEQKHLLTHIHTIEDPSFKRATDIVVISSGKFILSLPTYFTSKWFKLLEVFLFRGYGSLLFYNGKTTTTLESGLNGPNSLLWSEQERRLFVSLKYSREIRVYKLAKDLKLLSITVVSLMSSPNSMSLKDNDIWLGADTQGHREDWIGGDNPVHALRVRFQDKALSSWVLTEPFSSTKKRWNGINGVISFPHGLLLTSPQQSMFCPISEMDLI